MPPRIGVVAGTGDMSERVIAACRERWRDPFVIGLRDQADPTSFWPASGRMDPVGRGGQG